MKHKKEMETISTDKKKSICDAKNIQKIQM